MHSTKVIDSVLETIIFIAVIVAVAPLLSTYLGYLAGNMTGFGLTALYAAGGILYLLFAYFVFNHVYKMWLK